MPELPDVEMFKRYVDATALHKQIAEIDVRAEQILSGISAEDLRSALERQAFVSTERHGKHLFLALENHTWLGLHFGMTGFLKYFRDEEDAPPHTRVLFRFENGYHLAYDSQRKLGEITLIKDKEKFLARQEIGIDVLSPDYDYQTFQEALSGRRGMIKTTLMNQKLAAGIGNVYADEILFQAGIHPKTSVKDLNESDLHKLLRTMKKVLQTAIDHQADSNQFPDSFLLKDREEGAPCPQCEGKIHALKVSGRTSYYCPTCQPEPSDS